MQLAEYQNTFVDQDIFDLLGSVPPKAYALFIELKTVRDYINNRCAYVTPKGKLEAVQFSKAMSHLKRIGLVKRYKVDVFMINPALLRCKENDTATAVWEML